MLARLRKEILIGAAVIGGAIACVAPPPDDGVSSGDMIQTSSGGSGKKPDTDGPMLVPIAVGGTADTTSASAAAVNGTVWVDQVACTIARQSMETGVEGRGWTLLVDATCPDAVTIAVNGVTDLGYPQTDVSNAIGRDAVALQKAGAGDGPDTFTTAAEGGASSITAGPTNADRAPVFGSALVVDATGASHTVGFDVKF
jgi:hypothetical protein